MGLDDGQLELNSPNGTYYSSQTVQGKLIIQQDKVKIFRGIYVKLKGFCYVHWTTRRSKTVNGKKEYRTINHSAHEEYINYKVYLVGGESGEHSTGPGRYEYPFHFRLPDNCPASFEGQYGHIRYEIKAVVDGALQLDQEKKIAVRVVAPVDLNLDPYCREPIEIQMEEIYRCCCISSGACDVSVNLPVSGYCPGQVIPVELVCNNRGRVQINNIKLCLMKNVTYISINPNATAENGRQPSRYKCMDRVVEIKKGPIPSNTNRNWTVEMEVPAMDVYDLSGCQYIKLEYAFKVIINPKGCHTDTEDFRKIVIGTVPLVGYQDNVPNPLQDQLPLSMPEKSSYPPTTNTYPEDNPPFPNPGPYPGSSPFPPANSYPNSDKPNSSYPPNSSSYPSANPLYPNVTPYMDNPPPYPGNLTDPGSNPTYPSEKSPFLDANLRNPGAKVDPGSNSPGGGSGMNLPLLPPNNPVSPRPVSPYAAASAPALHSPDIAEKD